MGTVRREVEIDEGLAAKLKRVADARGCTEEDVLRAAIEGLPDARQEGAVVRRRPAATDTSETGRRELPREVRDAMRERLAERLRARGANPRLTDAVLEERDESDRCL